jgi:hypothetical protein
MLVLRTAFLCLIALTLTAAQHDKIAAALIARQPASLTGAEATGDYVVFDRWPDRKPRTIFAVLRTDSEGGADVFGFRVDRGGVLTQLAALGETDARGIELRDVTGDGVAELLVSLTPGNRSAPVEIVRWNGRRFTTIGETSDNAIYVDLDHDGVPEVVTHGCCERNECDVVIAPPFIARFGNGGLVSEESSTLAAVIVLDKTAAAREVLLNPIALPDEFSTKCRLRIINGDYKGRHRAASLDLRVSLLDDDAVAHPGRGVLVHTKLSRDRDVVEMPLQLPSRCAMIETALTGPAGATVTIVVQTTH